MVLLSILGTNTIDTTNPKKDRNHFTMKFGDGDVWPEEGELLPHGIGNCPSPKMKFTCLPFEPATKEISCQGTFWRH